MIIEQPTWLLRPLMPEATFRLPAEEGRSAFLTFDDGPVPGVTDAVLDILDDYGVKGTFFVVGDNVRKHPALYDEVLRRGHTVGNHTMHHLNALHTERERYLADVGECGARVQSRLFRPPHGWVGRATRRELCRCGYRLVMYDVVTRDYSRYVDAAGVVERVKRYVRNGSLVVFHDSERTAGKIERALPEAIEWLLGQGYALMSLNCLLHGQ